MKSRVPRKTLAFILSLAMLNTLPSSVIAVDNPDMPGPDNNFNNENQKQSGLCINGEFIQPDSNIRWYNQIWGFEMFPSESAEFEITKNGNPVDKNIKPYEFEDGVYDITYHIPGQEVYTYSIGLDRTKPEFNIIYNPDTKQMRFVCKSDDSGIASYSVNGPDQYITPDAYGIVENAEGYGSATVKDGAGNDADFMRPEVYTISVDTNGHTAGEIPSNEPVVLDVEVPSEISVPYKVQYTYNNGEWYDLGADENSITVENTDGYATYTVRLVCDDESEFEMCRTSVDVNVNSNATDNTVYEIYGEQDEEGWFTEVPVIKITAPYNKSIRYYIDGVAGKIEAGRTVTIPENYLDDGMHSVEFEVFSENGIRDIHTEIIQINAVKPEIDSFSVNTTVYKTDGNTIYCHGTLNLSFNMNSEVKKYVLVCDGEPVDTQLYSMKGKNTVIFNADAVISGKIGIVTYDNEGSEITYYMGEITDEFSNSFSASAVSSSDNAYTIVFDNTVPAVPEIMLKYRTSDNTEREEKFSDKSEVFETEWSSKTVRMTFIEQNGTDYQYQFRKASDSEWTDYSGNVTEFTEGGEYIFRAVSRTGVISDELKINIRICQQLPNQAEISIIDSLATNSEWFSNLTLEIRDENQNGTDIPETVTYCNIFRTGETGTEQIGAVELKAGEKSVTKSISDDITVTNTQSAALFEINNSGIYEFVYYTIDEAGNFTEESSEIYKVQIEKPVIHSIELGGINLLTEKMLYFMSADLSELSIDADYGFSGKADKDAVVYEYKSKMSQQWKRCENLRLINDSRYDVRVTITNKAGMKASLENASFIVDSNKPTGGNEFPEIVIKDSGTEKNGIYSGEINVDLYVKDPEINGVCSGLNNVSYQVKDNLTGEILISEKIYQFDVEKSNSIEDVCREFSQSIVIPAWVDTNFTLTVAVVDNSGNSRTTSKVINQDTAAPEIVVSYDNNHTVNGVFNASRTAKISIAERNFNAADVTIQASNSDGAQPVISAWTSDGYTHTATVSFSDDGNYTFSVDYTDKAGNKAEVEMTGEKPESFVIDKTAPVVNLSFDNNDSENGSYYDKKRTATITVTEKNLDSSSLSSGVKVSAMLDGKAVEAPEINWTSSGESHIGTVEFSNDAHYTLDVSVSDTAGNTSGVPSQSFTIDTKAPVLNITGVNNKSANKDSVMPVIEFSDSNLDESSVSIKLTGANNGEVALQKENYRITNGSRIAVNNFVDVKSLKDDDLYTLDVAVTDKAGLSTSKTIEFSINRTGPVYVVDPELSEYLNNYNREPREIKISVYDVDPIVASNIDIIKDGTESNTIFAGRDYVVETILPDEEKQIYRYTYEYIISAKNFEDNGTYNVILTAKDNASNSSDNTASRLGLKADEEKETSTEIRFTIDNIAPTVIFDNLASNGKYNTDSKKVSFVMHDNISSLTLDSIEVFVNGNKVNVSDDGEKYGFFIGSSSEIQNVLVKCKDTAGNICELSFDNILVTSDKFKLYQKQIIAALIVLLAMVISGTILITRKNSKKSK